MTLFCNLLTERPSYQNCYGLFVFTVECLVSRLIYSLLCVLLHQGVTAK